MIHSISTILIRPPSNGWVICIQPCRFVRTVRKPSIIRKDENDMRKQIATAFEKRLDVVIMGSPNAGKSVLLNVLVEDKLAATSRKRHTTQREILGVVNYKNTQLAFYDTPGFESPFSKSQYKRKFSVELSKIAVESTQKADIVLIVIDAYKRFDDKVKIEFAAMVRNQNFNSQN